MPSLATRHKASYDADPHADPNCHWPTESVAVAQTTCRLTATRPARQPSPRPVFLCLPGGGQQAESSLLPLASRPLSVCDLLPRSHLQDDPCNYVNAQTDFWPVHEICTPPLLLNAPETLGNFLLQPPPSIPQPCLTAPRLLCEQTPSHDVCITASRPGRIFLRHCPQKPQDINDDDLAKCQLVPRSHQNGRRDMTNFLAARVSQDERLQDFNDATLLSPGLELWHLHLAGRIRPAAAGHNQVQTQDHQGRVKQQFRCAGWRPSFARRLRCSPLMVRLHFPSLPTLRPCCLQDAGWDYWSRHVHHLH
ncbi:hypothetical protein BCR44DRAFT_1259041 [Catenaria anguillulae PL171]|uniref:Uncharacterized protein n=1 Tax=Catenaria anguillulae PL171 TaxID=765915 RepID=A0A1Y2HB95_9FUNG|nr:hypothetical protein BCR44DRAFT_1259041 [Catenaria anguillulae PL171]